MILCCGLIGYLVVLVYLLRLKIKKVRSCHGCPFIRVTNPMSRASCGVSGKKIEKIGTNPFSACPRGFWGIRR